MYNEATLFLNKLFEYLDYHNLDLGAWEIDHICYRCSTPENYEKTKATFASLGKCLIETEINGRNIATYKLDNPIVYKDHIIDLVEVPAPKKNKTVKDGFEHIEVVIDVGFSEIEEKYPDLNYNKTALNKTINPELEIEFSDCALKFHHKSLEHIINIEKNKNVSDFLEYSQILAKLAKYSPCISGTIPLTINKKTSDLDILFSAKDLESFAAEASELFSEYRNFRSLNKDYQDLKSVIISFNYNDLPVELFCQDKDVFKQQANQHFLIEGRLIKLLGPKFKDEILSLRNSGLKTEPAFGEILGLNKPYQDLLPLNLLTDLQIKEKYNFLVGS